MRPTAMEITFKTFGIGYKQTKSHFESYEKYK